MEIIIHHMSRFRRESTPTQDQVKTFIRVCDMFWSKHPDLQIGNSNDHAINESMDALVSVVFIFSYILYTLQAFIVRMDLTEPVS